MFAAKLAFFILLLSMSIAKGTPKKNQFTKNNAQENNALPTSQRCSVKATCQITSISIFYALIKAIISSIKFV